MAVVAWFGVLCLYHLHRAGGLGGQWVPQGSCSAGGWSGTCFPPPSSDHCLRSSTPMGTVGLEVCRCLAFKSQHWRGGLFLHASCHVTPRTVNGFARVLLCWPAGLCRAQKIQVTAFCLRKGTRGRERFALKLCMSLAGLTWALRIIGIELCCRVCTACFVREG